MTTAARRTLYLKTFGCQMNVYDSERMSEALKPLGYVSVETPEGADLVILNTCHIREKAAEKVYSDLGQLRRMQAEKAAAGGRMRIAVAGCVAQAEGEEVRARAPFVDFVLGPQTYHRLPELIARAERAEGGAVEVDLPVDEKFDRLPEARGAGGPARFLTIQEGCDKFCAFCVVPYTRGAEWSRPVDQIVAEARALVRAGAREVTLLGQNVNAYHGAPPAGAEADGAWGLGRLVRHLAKIDRLDRIRFTTSHPRDMDDDLIAALGEEPKLMPYLHLPVQAGSDKILKAMNRGHTCEDYVRLIERVRAARPDIALSGDFIVGFPGETEGDFEGTLALVREVTYASAFSFKYSKRPGTPAAAAYGQVAEGAKAERLARLQTLLEEQRQAFNRSLIGRTLPVLFEKAGRKDGQLIGRSPYLQSVFATAPEALLGEIAQAEILAAKPNSLEGRLVAHADAPRASETAVI